MDKGNLLRVSRTLTQNSDSELRIAELHERYLSIAFCIHSLIHSFNKYLLSNYYVPDIVLETVTLNKIHEKKIIALMKLTYSYEKTFEWKIESISLNYT